MPDEAMMMNLTASISKMMGGMLTMDQANPQDMIQLGLGMGMALLSSGAIDGIVSSNANAMDAGKHPPTDPLMGAKRDELEAHTDQGSLFPSVAEDGSIVSHIQEPSIQDFNGEPIGLAFATEDFSAEKPINQDEAWDQKEKVASRIHQPLNSLEVARGLRLEIRPSETPDAIPEKVLVKTLPPNADQACKEVLPVVAYPELSQQPEGGAPVAYTHKAVAGEGTSFVALEKAEKQLMVEETKFRKMVMPLPVGFYEAISAKHIAKQAVDYLPQVPNIPQSRTIGRVKPRSSAADWLMINFDPWSAGRNPLGTEFVPSLMAKADKLLSGGAVKAQEDIESMRDKTLNGAFAAVIDEAGLQQQRAEVSRSMLLSQDFKKLCSMCRHSKFQDAEALMNQPDWNVPIDYQDDQGNTLLHVVAQNGNKRLVKLCLRRGANLNVQNLTGQTALHFAYGYGYAEVGDYLISKGADDSVKNKDGLSCYEGLAATELALL